MKLILDKFSLLFFGTDAFSVGVLRHLINAKLCQVQVVTKAGSLLDEYSATNNIKRHRWPLDVDERGDFHFNIGLVASFGKLIDTKTVNSFPLGLFNVHPSLLPQYRGSTPVQAAIRNNLTQTGCSIMRISPIPKFDIGEIILQEKLSIDKREYATDLRDRLANLGGKMAKDFLLNYDECMQNIKAQPEIGKSYAKKLKPEDGCLKFQSETWSTIDSKVRAYTGYIDLYTDCLNGLRVRLYDLRDPEETTLYDLDKLAEHLCKLKRPEATPIRIPAGTMYFHKPRKVLCIKCLDNRWLAFDHVSPCKKCKFSSLDFYNGYLSKVDPINRKTDL